MRGIKPVPIQLQAGLAITFAARVEMRVTGRLTRAGEGIVEGDYFSVGRVGVAVLHRAAGIDDRRDVEVGIVAVIIIARALPLVLASYQRMASPSM